ncbi:uncharacterized protein LOC143102048 [Alosa pseudoharengus]|uniref:uncharacterized protein LOC143102048 n=1 Tax=Alosa pseudoharengus TaxID=34774 RepID=UPI003F887798
MDPRGLNKEIPNAKKTIEINRHHLKQLRKVLSDFTPYPVSKPSEKIWAPEKECLANTPEATASNQSTDSVSHDPQIPSSVPLLHTYAPISEEEPMIDADVPPFTPHFSNESQPVTVESEEESTYSALLVKIEMLKKIRIAPIKQPGPVLMAPNKDDKDVHDTGGHGIESAKEEGDLLETKLEFKINETANEPWMRLEKVVKLVVAEHLTVFEKNLQELYGRMMKIEMAIKEQTQIHKLSRELQMAKEDLISRNVSMVDANEPTPLSTPATASTPTQGPSDVSNPEKPGGLPAEQSSCQTNSKDVLDSHLTTPNLPMYSATGNFPFSVRPAPQPCMVQPVTCPPSHSCSDQPGGHGQYQQDTLAGHPHNAQNVLSSLAVMAADSFPASQLLLQATAQAAQRPDTYPRFGFSHAGPGSVTPVLYPTTAAPLSGGLAAPAVTGTLMSPTVHPPGDRDDNICDSDGGGDGANDSHEGKYYIEPEESDSVDAFTHLKVSRPGNWKSSFAINPPPSLPRLASLLCLSQLPHDALWTPVPGQPVLSICLTNQKAVELTWSMPVEDRAALERVHSYHLFACPVTTSLAPQRLAWKNIGVVRAETLPMTYRLTDIQAGCKFFFAVCAQDIYTRFGPFSRPLYLKWLFGSSLVD